MGLLDPVYRGLLPYDYTSDAQAARAAAAARLARGVRRPNVPISRLDYFPDVAEDVVRTIPGSLVRGATAVVGLPGDAQTLLGAGARWAGGQLGASDHVEQALSVARRAVPQFPTSGEIQSAVENVTGEFYKPQTRAGKYVGTALEFVPGALVGGPLVGGARTLGGAALRYGVAPGLLSEAAGHLAEGTSVEPIARAAGAIGGLGAAMWTAPRAAQSSSGRAMRGLDEQPPLAANAQLPAGGAIGDTAQSSYASRAPVTRDPPALPQRPFTDDYPHGARHDRSGRLTRDMEGRPLIAEFVAGRTHVNKPDTALTPEQIETLAQRLTGEPAWRIPPEAMQGAVGRTLYGPVTGKREHRIVIDRTYPLDEQSRTVGHEVGHVTKDKAGRIRNRPFRDELDANYRTLRASGKSPENIDYPDRDVVHELWAEFIRAYLTAPNYVKTLAPKAAAALRKAVNENPELAKIIQFNTLAGGTAVGLDAVGGREGDL